MLLRPLPALLLAATTAHALKDASPFLLLSNEALILPEIEPKQITTSQELSSQLAQSLEHCSEVLYLLVSQPGLRTSDVQDGAAMPELSARIANQLGEGFPVVQIPFVLGNVDVRDVARQVEGKCDVRLYEGAEDKAWATSLKGISVPVLPGDLSRAVTAEERKKVLRQNDAYLSAHLPALGAAGQPYVLIFTGGPATTAKAAGHVDLPYEMDEPYPSALHTDLKRDVRGARKARAASGKDAQRDLALFERYQYLTPALFMGLSVTILLGLILYVGISAIAGLEVSYAAFSKEMGPAAQNKGKQQ